jgi:hypothetical protein
MMSSEQAASAVAVIVPSPLAGEGGSMLARAMMGEGYVAATPHPIRVLGQTFAPSPARGEGAKGEVVPAKVGTHDRRRRLWVPALAALGRDDESLERGINLRMYETAAGAISLFWDCYLQ